MVAPETRPDSPGAAAGGLVLLLSSLAGLALMVVLVFDPTWVREHVRYSVILDHGFGVSALQPVTIAGREVGYVEAVELTDDRTVRLSLVVEAPYARHVHEDSTVQVLQLLSGRYVEIRGGRGTPLAPGGELFIGTNFDPFITLADLDLPATLKEITRLLTDVARLFDAMDLENQDLVAAIGSVSRLLQKLERGEGTVGRLLDDDAPLEEGLAVLKRVDALLERTESLLANVDAAATEVGSAGKALSGVSQDIGGAASALGQTAAGLDRTLEPVPDTLRGLDAALRELAVTLEAIQKMPGLRRQVDKDAE